MMPASRFIGPDRGADCPCGSGRNARVCHAFKDGTWWGENPALLSLNDPPTGFAHPKCYARSLSDCSTKISREHYISAALLESAGPINTFEGFGWAKGKEVTLPTQAITANILCERHNNALSPLDSTAARIFRFLRDAQEELGDPALRSISRFTLESGPIFERWMLKTAWGLVLASALTAGGKPLVGLRSDADETLLLRALFYGEPLPPGWGFHMSGVPDMPIAAEGQLEILSGSPPGDPHLWTMTFAFGVVRFEFTLGKPEPAPRLDVVYGPPPI